MAVALRHVKIEGRVLESFIGIVHAKDTRALLLSKGIEALFSMHGLSIKVAKPRIQGSQQYTRKLTLWWIAQFDCDVLFSVVVLEIVEDNDANSQKRAKAFTLIEAMQSFDFVRRLHLMKNVLEITHELPQDYKGKSEIS